MNRLSIAIAQVFGQYPMWNGTPTATKGLMLISNEQPHDYIIYNAEQKNEKPIIAFSGFEMGDNAGARSLLRLADAMNMVTEHARVHTGFNAMHEGKPSPHMVETLKNGTVIISMFLYLQNQEGAGAIRAYVNGKKAITLIPRQVFLGKKANAIIGAQRLEIGARTMARLIPEFYR